MARIPNRKCACESRATHLIPLSVTDKLVKTMARAEAKMETPSLVSMKWIEEIANTGKLPKKGAKFPIPEVFL